MTCSRKIRPDTGLSSMWVTENSTSNDQNLWMSLGEGV